MRKVIARRMSCTIPAFPSQVALLPRPLLGLVPIALVRLLALSLQSLQLQPGKSTVPRWPTFVITQAPILSMAPLLTSAWLLFPNGRLLARLVATLHDNLWIYDYHQSGIVTDTTIPEGPNVADYCIITGYLHHHRHLLRQRHGLLHCRCRRLQELMRSPFFMSFESELGEPFTPYI